MMEPCYLFAATAVAAATGAAAAWRMLKKKPEQPSLPVQAARRMGLAHLLPLALEEEDVDQGEVGGQAAGRMGLAHLLPLEDEDVDQGEVGGLVQEEEDVDQGEVGGLVHKKDEKQVQEEEEDQDGVVHEEEKDQGGLVQEEEEEEDQCGLVQEEEEEEDQCGLVQEEEKDQVGMVQEVEKDQCGVVQEVEKEQGELVQEVEKDQCGVVQEVEKEHQVAEPRPSAQVVAQWFIPYYYNTLHLYPEFLYCLFLNASNPRFPETTQPAMTAVLNTLRAISQKVDIFECADSRGEIWTMQAQDSLDGGVVVVVTGYLAGQDNVPHEFCQSFFLARQYNGYYVVNDIFRYFPDCDSESAGQVLPSTLQEKSSVLQ